MRITGYFFKIQGYKSEEGIQVAPLLIANKIEQISTGASPGPMAAEGEQIGRGIFIAFCVILAFVGGVVLDLFAKRPQGPPVERPIRSSPTAT